jgi:hypothetical protein
MHKPTTFVLTAAVLLTAIVSVTLYTFKTANAQSNMTSAGGANMTKSNMTKGNMTGTAMGAAKNMTGTAMGAAKNMTGK